MHRISNQSHSSPFSSPSPDVSHNLFSSHTTVSLIIAAIFGLLSICGYCGALTAAQADPNTTTPTPNTTKTNETTTNDPNTAQDPALTQVVHENETVAAKGQNVTIKAGHLDIAPKYLNGKFELMVRDDTATTPTWRHLEDVVFQVTDKALMAKPDATDYHFIKADGGHQVFVAPQVEMPGVIWLGWSTQDPQLVSKVNGGLNLIYAGHQGDGQLVTFLQSGNFGKPKVLWDSTKNHSQPLYLDTKTHMHANWVFTKSGIHLVRFTITGELQDGKQFSSTKILRFAVGDTTDVTAAHTENWTQLNDITPAESSQAARPSALDNSKSLPIIVAISLAIAAIILVIAVSIIRRKTAEKQTTALAKVNSDNHE